LDLTVRRKPKSSSASTESCYIFVPVKRTCTYNAVETLLQPNITSADFYSDSEIYRFKCMNCRHLYIGQTDRTYLVMYSEQFYETDNKLLLLQIGLQKYGKGVKIKSSNKCR